MANPRRDFRAGVLMAFGAVGPVVEELLAFGDAAMHSPGQPPLALPSPPSDGGEGRVRGMPPLPPEPHVEAWREYVAEATHRGAWDVLRRRLPQFQFPVRAGISQTEAYRAATRRGEAVIAPDGEAKLGSPNRLRLWVHETLAGPIPVLCTADREDFVWLVQALSCRNEPLPVPDSMAGCLVSGFNNWDRFRRLRERHAPEAWAEEFGRIVAEKALYQDRFLILGEGPYSGVSADAMGLPPDEWLHVSHTIRLVHECAHYLSLRLYGPTPEHPLDELIADYVGVAAAAGRYRADWALRFLGLDDSSTYREGGRLENYRGPLSETAFRVLQRLMRAAADNLERFDSRTFSGPLTEQDRMLLAPMLFQASLEEMASPSPYPLPHGMGERVG
jgi:hypothetical protein